MGIESRRQESMSFDDLNDKLPILADQLGVKAIELDEDSIEYMNPEDIIMRLRNIFRGFDQEYKNDLPFFTIVVFGKDRGNFYSERSKFLERKNNRKYYLPIYLRQDNEKIIDSIYDECSTYERDILKLQTQIDTLYQRHEIKFEFNQNGTRYMDLFNFRNLDSILKNLPPDFKNSLKGKIILIKNNKDEIPDEDKYDFYIDYDSEENPFENEENFSRYLMSQINERTKDHENQLNEISENNGIKGILLRRDVIYEFDDNFRKVVDVINNAIQNLPKQGISFLQNEFLYLGPYFFSRISKYIEDNDNDGFSFIDPTEEIINIINYLKILKINEKFGTRISLNDSTNTVISDEFIETLYNVLDNLDDITLHHLKNIRLSISNSEDLNKNEIYSERNRIVLTIQKDSKPNQIASNLQALLEKFRKEKIAREVIANNIAAKPFGSGSDLFSHIFSSEKIEEFLSDPALENILDISSDWLSPLPENRNLSELICIVARNLFIQNKEINEKNVREEYRTIIETKNEIQRISIYHGRNVVCFANQETDSDGYRFGSKNEIEEIRNQTGENQNLGSFELIRPDEEDSKKQEVIDKIVNTPPPMTFHFSTHGQKEYIALIGGSKKSEDDVRITYKDLALATQKRHEKFPELTNGIENKDIFILEACYSNNFARSYYDECIKNGLSNLPIIIGVAEYGQVGFGYPKIIDGYRSPFLEGVLNLLETEHPINVGEIIENQYKGPSNVSIFIPSENGNSFRQIARNRNNSSDLNIT